jgi:Uma2 family endonuclease
MRTDSGGSLDVVPTLVLDPVPAALEELLEQRRRLDQDRRDEVWEGVLHMIPPPSSEHERPSHRLHVLLDSHAQAAGLEVLGTVGIGDKDDHRVPDLTVQRPPLPSQWHPTAALVVEIVSRGDETYEKLPFYAAHGVDEVVIVDPEKRIVDWRLLEGSEYRASERSGVIALGSRELASQIGWA